MTRILDRLAAVVGVSALAWSLGAAGLAARAPQLDAESATSERLAAIRADPAALRAFLDDMPKGGDLHNHLSGAVYAESYVRWAQQDNDCFLTTTLAIVAPPCDAAMGRLAAADAFRDPAALDQAIDSLSVTEAKQRLGAAEARPRQLLRCGTPMADPGCQVTVRYISNIIRTATPARVFAQMVAGFEIASAEPRVVGVNMVAPEDDVIAVADYSLHMRMLDALHALYPNVRITLHAGEIVPALAPPDALRSHIREAIEVGHAERIGHGVDVGGEDNAADLFREMGSRHILVEIALTSNDLILGVRGQEFVKAVVDQGVDYRTLKRMVRNSLEYAFADARTKARLQSKLDDDFQAFERRQ